MTRSNRRHSLPPLLLLMAAALTRNREHTTSFLPVMFVSPACIHIVRSPPVFFFPYTPLLSLSVSVSLSLSLSLLALILSISQRTHRSAYSLTNNPIHPISARNEIAALLLMAQAARKQLSRYPQTYEEDLASLASDGLTPFSNRRHATIVVKSEKEILTWFVNLSEECTPVLSLPIEDAVAVVNERYSNSKDDTSRYLRSTVYGLRNRSRW